MSIKIEPGFAEAHRDLVGQLFWDAFRAKLHRCLAPDEKALAFIRPNLNPRFAFSALAPDGTLLGVAGIKTEKGGLLGGDYDDLRRVYGLWSGLWRGALLSQFERPVEPNTLLMDGIFVSEDARGQGVGSELLKAVIWTAQMNGYGTVRLDVVDTNPRARALYERMGFRPTGVIDTGVLAPFVGFKSATTMVKAVEA